MPEGCAQKTKIIIQNEPKENQKMIKDGKNEINHN